MRLDLSEVATHVGKHISYQIDEPPIVDDESGLACTKRITGWATFSNTGRHIVVRGSFATEIRVECARCLREYALVVDHPIEEELQLAGIIQDVRDEQEFEELAPEDREPLFEDNVLDLTDLLRQNILIAVPIKPVCSEECRGLCPHCGKNLNEGPCGCPPDVEGSPFAGLASLLDEEEKET